MVQFVLDLYRSPFSPNKREDQFKIFVLGAKNSGKTALIKSLFPKEGWLKSQGTILRKEYWVKLQGIRLEKFDGQQSSAPHKGRSTYLAKGAWTVSSMEECGIVLSSQELRLQFYAGTPKEAREWLEHLQDLGCYSLDPPAVRVSRYAIELSSQPKKNLNISIWDFVERQDITKFQSMFSPRSVYLLPWSLKSQEMGLRGLKSLLKQLKTILPQISSLKKENFMFILVATHLDLVGKDEKDSVNGKVEKILEEIDLPKDMFICHEISNKTGTGTQGLKEDLFKAFNSLSNFESPIPRSHLPFLDYLNSKRNKLKNQKSPLILDLSEAEEMFGQELVDDALASTFQNGDTVPIKWSGFGRNILLDPEFLTADMLGL